LLARKPGGILRIRLQQAYQRVPVGGEQVFAPDVQDDPLADLVALAEVLHQAEVLVAAVGGFDGAEEQGSLLLHCEYSTGEAHIHYKNAGKGGNVCHYTVSKTEHRLRVFNGLRTERPKKRKHAPGYSPDPARIVEWVEEAYQATNRLMQAAGAR
jgi:hypothetical protein